MADDFYCDEVLSGNTSVQKAMETSNVLAFHHTRPSYPVHIVVIPKQHINSLIALDDTNNDLLLEMMNVIKQVAQDVLSEYGACRVVTNLGDYQDSEHLHWHVVSGERLK